MTELIIFLKYELIAILASFFMVVFYMLLTQKINLQGLLHDKKTQAISPSRIQKLVFVLIVAVYYLALTYKNPLSFPQLPDFLLYMLSGSSLGYLLAKAKSMPGFLQKWF
jgi:hypothetical protein